MKIFVSYDNQQITFAEYLRDELHSWGYTVQLPLRDVTMGRNRLAAVDENLLSANVVIGLLSKSALSNMAVCAEWNWSIVHQHEQDTQLILLRLDDCIIPSAYRHIPRFDVYTSGREAAIASLKEALQNPDTYSRKPVRATDEFHDYLLRTYQEVMAELNFLLIPPDADKPQIHMQRTYSNYATQDTLASFEHGFALYNNRAFLVGNPGVGKTITLLRQAINAILERLQDTSAPLPIIGSVVTWDAVENTPLPKWLSKNIHLPEAQIKQQLEHGNCLLLLDGVDELGSARVAKGIGNFDPRLRFLEQIFALPASHQLLITCRTEAFADILPAQPLRNALFLEKLSDAQIQQFLAVASHDNALWETVQSQPNLLETLRLPLLLGTFAFAYSKIPATVQSLAELYGGTLRDTIFERYIMKRFALSHSYYQSINSPVPFTVHDIYSMLGKVAKYGATKYGTGEVTFITPDNADYGADWIAVRDLTFGFVDDENTLAAEFVQFAAQLNLIHLRSSGTCTFVHRLMRNHFVFKYCVPIKPPVDTHVIDALGKIRDDRVPHILQGIINGDFPQSIRNYAQTVYEMLPDNNLVRS